MDRKHTSPKPTSPYKDIIFDMDGVLINSINVWLEVGMQGMKEINLECTREDMIKGIVKFTSLGKFGIPDLKQFGIRINEMFCERALEVTLQENIVPVLDALTTAKKRLSVVTTSGRTAVDSILKNLQIEGYFDKVITFDDVKKHKPDPEGILSLLKMNKTKKNEAIIIGDTRNDIVAGKAAGIDTVLYYPPWHEEIYDKDHLLALNADYYIRDLRELLSIVL